MAAKRAPRRQTFLWQGVLILLPMVVLAGIGFYSVRQDRRLAREDAVERGKEIAQDLLPKLWQAIENPTGITNLEQRRLVFDESGTLVFPAPAPGPPLPQPLEFSSLSQTQQLLWTSLHELLIRANETRDIDQKLQEFLRAQPPVRFAALAQFDVARSLIAVGEKAEAVEVLRNILQEKNELLAQSGVPLKPLCEFDLLRLESQKEAVLLPILCSNLVCRPTFLTPFLLGQLEQVTPGNDKKVVVSWNETWAAQRRNHEIFHDAVGLAAAPYPPFIWPRGVKEESSGMKPADSWLAIRTFPVPLGQVADRISPSNNIWPVNSFPNPVALSKPSDFDSTFTTGTAEGVPPQGKYWTMYLCKTEKEAADQIKEVVARQRGMPDYIGIGVSLAGRNLRALDYALREWKEIYYER